MQAVALFVWRAQSASAHDSVALPSTTPLRSRSAAALLVPQSAEEQSPRCVPSTMPLAFRFGWHAPVRHRVADAVAVAVGLLGVGRFGQLSHRVADAIAASPVGLICSLSVPGSAAGCCRRRRSPSASGRAGEQATSSEPEAEAADGRRGAM